MTTYINVRTLSAPTTGVQRYVHELSSRLPELQPVCPASGAQGVLGHVWEQFALPRRVSGGLLWSPANTGPLAVRNQVVTVHDMATLDHPEWFGRKFAHWYRYLLPRLVRNAAHILTVSASTKERVVDLCGVQPEKITVVPNGVDRRFFGRNRLLDLPQRYVLAVGSLEPRKNLPRLLAAWTEVSCHLDDVWLICAGGANADIFASSGLNRIPERVKFLGRVSDDELPSLYAGALASCFVPLYEGFGLPVLESMAAGTPVVASSIPAIKEIAGDCAVLVDPLEPDAIGAGILTAIGRRDELSARGVQHAKRFTWDAAALRVAEVLADHSICATRSSAPPVRFSK